MGLGRYAYVAGVVATIPLMGCSVMAAAVGEGAVGTAPNAAAGVRLEAVAHCPQRAGDGWAGGLRIDHVTQFAPGVTYDRSRYELMFGLAYVPRGFRRWWGYDLFVRAGFSRGAMGGAESTPIALAAGATVGLPLRVTKSRFGEDEVLRGTVMFVPQLDVGFAGPVEGGWQLQIGGSVGFRVYLDSTLLP